MPQITVTLNEGYEKINPTNPLGLTHNPLYHQHRTYEALMTNDLVINTYNTGTGKTIASLLRLFDLKGENVLFIAPTNELITQHVTDIQEFVEENRLNFHVVEVNAQKLRELEAIDDSGYRVRNPRKLHELIRNPRDYFPNLTTRKPLILVTNPDLFYLCFYMAYSELDKQNLFRDFLTAFDYVVIDEFHYYNAKQLANFLTFFIISKEYGYFDGTRKVCLLSATPDSKVSTYLNRIGDPLKGAQGLKWELISPENEPEDSQAYQRIKTLSAIELTIHSNKMRDTLSAQPELVRNLLNVGKDGAIISSSLRTISDMKQVLEKEGMKDQLGMITGAVSATERRQATKRFPLVLATPTVDIGYNFKKEDKRRQNIDFVCFDAHYAAEFTQRLGRAGRLLGKTETDVLSIGHAFVDGKLYTRLHAEGKERYDRREFAEIVKEVLGEDNRFYYYIESYAVLEAFQPIYHIFKTTLEDHQDLVRGTFDTIQKTFAPESSVTFDEMMKKFQWQATYGSVVEAFQQNAYNDYIQQQWRRAAWGYLKQKSWEAGTLEAFESTPDEKLNQAITGFLKRRSNRQSVAEYAEREHHLIESIFNFRNSEVGIRCGIYDPKHLFQNTSEYTYYDLFHILANCEYHQIEKKTFRELTGEWGDYCDFYVQVNGFQTPRRKIQFRYHAESDDQETFERRCCGRPIALKGFTLHLLYGTHNHPEPVPLEMQHFLRDRYITCLVSRMENRYALNKILETKRSIAYPLEVTFNNGLRKEYQLILGSEAFLIHAELKGKWKEKEQSQAMVELI